MPLRLGTDALAPFHPSSLGLSAGSAWGSVMDFITPRRGRRRGPRPIVGRYLDHALLHRVAWTWQIAVLLGLALVGTLALSGTGMVGSATVRNGDGKRKKWVLRVGASTPPTAMAVASVRGTKTQPQLRSRTRHAVGVTHCEK